MLETVLFLLFDIEEYILQMYIPIAIYRLNINGDRPEFQNGRHFLFFPYKMKISITILFLNFFYSN